MDVTSAAAGSAEFAAQAPRSFSGVKAPTAEKAHEMGKKFEAMFVTQMMNYMFTGLDGGKSYFGGGHAEEMFRPMLTDEYGKMVANQGNGIGLADKVAKVLMAHQEV